MDTLILNRLGKTEPVRLHLDHIFRTIKQSETTTLDEHDLSRFKIKVSRLDLDTEGSFFKPLPRSQLPQINWDEVNFSDWAAGETNEARRVDYTFLRVSSHIWNATFQNSDQEWIPRKYYHEDTNIGGSVELRPLEWQTTGEVEEKWRRKPHCSYRIFHYAEPSDALRRGEVLSLLRYMRWRMQQGSFLQHYTFPVLICSISRSKVRLLEAYHDGESLCISKSEFYDFKENVVENYQLFMQWIFGVPCGDTCAPLQITGVEFAPATKKRILSNLARKARLADARRKHLERHMIVSAT
ncbi:hypothetical protein BDV25DRAFT_146874 [Aspergillus avenaceus]|uniref:Uncharacterized protein n=1 Tax=Aspergillus avenaceus TaxID=36643 RepID=A0A5N6U8V1_ASPAV|nr:hypothetical protein BDV25DRAFT_146874 [Aspergillus avenaceus]